MIWHANRTFRYKNNKYSLLVNGTIYFIHPMIELFWKEPWNELTMMSQSSSLLRVNGRCLRAMLSTAGCDERWCYLHSGTIVEQLIGLSRRCKKWTAREFLNVIESGECAKYYNLTWVHFCSSIKQQKDDRLRCKTLFDYMQIFSKDPELLIRFARRNAKLLLFSPQSV